jgi:hypothetical protein
MKRLTAIFIIISMLFALCGCSGDSIIQDASENNDSASDRSFAFVGESETWAAMLKVNYEFMFYEEDGTLHHDGDDNSTLYVTYKGDISDLASVNILRIECGEDSLEDTFDNGHSSTVKTFRLPVSIGEITKDDTKKATVIADDVTQTIELKASNSKEIFANSNDDYIENHVVFKGESDSWTGEMTADSALLFYESDGVLGCDSEDKALLTVTYKGDVSDLASVKDMRIAYGTRNEVGSLSTSYSDESPLQEKTFTITTRSFNVANIEEDFVVTVTVTTDDNTETFEMGMTD